MKKITPGVSLKDLEALFSQLESSGDGLVAWEAVLGFLR